MIWRWSLREFTRDLSLNLFFIFNLGLGLTGFMSLESFKSSINSYLQSNAQKILSADLSVSARRFLTDDEIQKTRAFLNENSKQSIEESQVIEFFAMALNSKNESRLVLVKAIDDNYPMYGFLKLQTGEQINQKSPKNILKTNSLWAYPEIKNQLNVQAGDAISLGDLKLTVDNFISEDATQTFRLATLAPRVFINRDLLKKSNLLQYGSTLTQAFLYKIPHGIIINDLQSGLFKALPDPAIQVDTAETASQDSGRQLGYLSDFLGLSALVALFLSSFGAGFIYYTYLQKKQKVIAIYEVLGLQKIETLKIFILNLFLCGIFSLIPAWIGARILNPILSSLIGSISPFPLITEIPNHALMISAGIALGVCALLSLPFLDRIQKMSGAQLLRDDHTEFDFSKTRWWLLVPAFVFLLILSIWQSHSYKTGVLFFFSLVILAVLVSLLGWSFLWALERATLKLSIKKAPWDLKFSLLSLSRKKGANLAAFLSLALGALLINLLPQLKASLRADLSFDPNSPTPSVFLFDIQDEQINPLQELLKSMNYNMQKTSPMVRARILKINQENYERAADEKSTYRTREEEQEARFRNRGVNLSYRDSLSESETITKGRPLRTNFDSSQMAELSIEEKFAERMKIKIDDEILFDVQGVEIPGRVVNFRSVKWTSFQPNFFILFENGYLNEAPKTYIGLMDSLTESDKQKIMSSISQKFANVSMIDVHRIVENVLNMAEQLGWSLELMSALAVLTGLIILYSILNSQIRQRRWELNMLKILGASRGQILSYLLNEILSLSTLAAATGLILSFGFSALLMKFIFGNPIAFDWKTPLAVLIFIPSMALAIGYWISRKVVAESPIQLLREE